MLFLNEMLRKNVEIIQNQDGKRFSYRVRGDSTLTTITEKIPVSLYLAVPKEWGGRFEVKISTASSGKYRMENLQSCVYLDIFDN
jgi:hypothetical protein